MRQELYKTNATKIVIYTKLNQYFWKITRGVQNQNK